jgi:hypothetical protein
MRVAEASGRTASPKNVCAEGSKFRREGDAESGVGEVLRELEVCADPCSIVGLPVAPASHTSTRTHAVESVGLMEAVALKTAGGRASDCTHAEGGDGA